MNTHQGGCHCGLVRYEVDLDLSQPAIECNCSYCSKKGTILSFTARDNFKILQGEDKLKTYHFNKNVIDHPFCTNCGVQCFGFATNQDGTPGVAINVRTIDGVDLDAITRMPYDGKNA